MGSVKEIEVITPATLETMGDGEFVFSDRYSVFDWGEMPDLIDKKGAALATLSAYFFEVLLNKGILGHFRGLAEEGTYKRFHELNSYSNKMRVALVRVLKPAYHKDTNTYNYDIYNNEHANYLIPLEVIYRNKLGESASVFKRLSNGSITYKDLGLDHEPKPGEKLLKPIIDVSTKLEHTDRYMKWDEAQKISGLTADGIEKIKTLTLEISKIITEECAKVGIENEDGKFEFGLDTKGRIILIDVLGTPDECRFVMDGFHISKEFARRWYRKTAWFIEVEKAKKERGSDWKTFVKSAPPPLPPEVKTLLSHLYQAVTNEITGKKLFTVPPLKTIIEGLKRHDS
ncbi:MAG: phosphoribosylaminoimidazolesuccinocarboxamide synthase [bacterium]